MNKSALMVASIVAVLSSGCGGDGTRGVVDSGVTLMDTGVDMDAAPMDTGTPTLPGNPLPDGRTDCVGDPITLDPVGSVDRWSFGDVGSGFMHPGKDCIGCHATNGGPRLTIGGTVMDAWHEPDDCFGAEGVTIEIIGADGVSTFMHSNATGNFYTNASIALPYTAKLTGADGATREMFTPQMDLDCAHCHTQDGANGAPGRIGVP